MKILVCVDTSPQSETTVQFGSYITQILGGESALLHVAPTTAVTSTVAEHLSQLKTYMPDASTIIRQGTAVSEIVDVCRNGSYDMILVGAPTVHGIGSGAAPSVSQSLTSDPPASVLVTRQTTGPLARILICDSGLPVSQPVIAAGAHVADAAGASVRLLHVADPVPQMYIGLKTMEETVDDLLATDTPIAQRLRWAQKTLAAAGVPAELTLRHGIVLDEIVQETQSEAYDLVVLGAPQRQTMWQSLLMGQIAPKVVEQVGCPVLVVRH